MKVLIVHNHYQQAGGEDVVVEQETGLLRNAGHEVTVYRRTNDEINALSWWQKALLPKRAVWASDTFRAVRDLIRREKPAIVHVHNTWLMVSPAVYYACWAERVPVIQTLHNYRMLCPNALFFRKEHVCEDCLGQTPPWPGIVHACYRGSRKQTTIVAAMLALHRWRKTWQNKVHTYIALTAFARQKFIQGGFPSNRLVVKPHFVHPDPGIGTSRGEYVLFVGRLSHEKGVRVLLAAWEQLFARAQLKIVGDGPLAQYVREAAQRSPTIEWLGGQTLEQVYALLHAAACVVIPSVCYETFGRIAIEAFATGIPVIAAEIGALAELVEPGRTGLRFRPGDAADLAEQVDWLMSHPADRARMGRAARAEFEAKYTAARNYQMLLEIYEDTLARTGEKE